MTAPVFERGLGPFSLADAVGLVEKVIAIAKRFLGVLVDRDRGGPRLDVTIERHAFYRMDNNIYTAAGGERAFWVSGIWWHSHEGGAEYYESGNWIYSKDGTASFYYSA